MRIIKLNLLLITMFGISCSNSEYTAATGGILTTTESTSEELTNNTENGTSSGGKTECDPENGSVQEICAIYKDRPYCSASGDCVSCKNLEKTCAEIISGLPVCSANGSCMECDQDNQNMCANEIEICDPSTFTCVTKCQMHEDCEDGRACDFETGICFPPTQVRWVNSKDVQCQPLSESVQIPFCELGQAIVWANAQPQGAQITINIINTSKDIVPITVKEGRAIAIRAGSGSGITLHAEGMAMIRVSPTSTLILQGIHLANNLTGAGLMCEQGRIWADQSMITGNKLAGIEAQGCEILVRRSILGKNAMGGIQVTDGTKLRIENSFITANGYMGGLGGIVVLSGSLAEIIYSTLIDNRGWIGTSFGVQCYDDDLATDETVSIRNSVVLNEGYNAVDFLSCNPIEITTTAYGVLPKDIQGQGNLAVSWDDFDTLLVADSENPEWVFRSRGDSLLYDLGIWHSSDPIVDFDGKARPSIDGDKDFVGAALAE